MERTFTIAKQGVTVSFTADGKPYDGTDTAAITGCSLAGVVGSEDVTCDDGDATAAFASADFGTWTVTGTGFALAGDDLANYYIATVNTTSATIAKQGVTVSFTADGKPYDGTDTAAITGCSLAGVVGSEDVTCDDGDATAAFASADFGTWTVTGTGFALAGDDLANYYIATVNTTSATSARSRSP